MPEQIVRMQAPNGQIKEVPLSQAGHYQRLGAKVVLAARPAPQPLVAPPPALRPDLAEIALSALPAMGGAAGGTLGAVVGAGAGGVGALPGGLGGAMLGGAAGESARQLLSRALGRPSPTAPGAIIRRQLGAAQEQALAELGGRGLGAVLRGGGRMLMRGAIRPSPTITREFGDVTGTALRERVAIGRMPGRRPSGAVLARALRQESAQALERALSEAEKRGVRFTAQDLVDGVSDLLRDIKRQPLNVADYTAVRKMLLEFVETRRMPRRAGRMGALLKLTPRDVNELKQAAQNIARPIYKAREAGTAGPRLIVRGRFHEAIGRSARRALEREIPEALAINRRTQALIGLEQAMKAAEARNPPMPQALNPFTWPVLQSMVSPAVQSRVALGATAPMVQETVPQLPRTLWWLLTSTPPPAEQPPDTTMFAGP